MQSKFLTAVLLCSLFVPAFAQQPNASDTGPAGQSVKGAQLKNKAPINTQSLKITLPKTSEVTLKNGIRVTLIEDHKLPTLFVQLILLDRGDSADPKDQRGIARATAVQLREGTKTRSARQLSEELDSLGGSFSGYTNMMDTDLAISGLSEHTDKLLAIFADVILHPTFPKSELDLYKSRLTSQLQSQRAQPGFMAREQFNRAVYKEHPAGVIAPSDDEIKKLSADDLKAFHDRYYRPNAALLFVSGDIKMGQLQPKLESIFAEWKPSDIQPPSLPTVQPISASKVLVVNRPGAVQTSLLMGTLTTRGDDPDRPALGVMNQILGGGPASRLFMNLREDKGYTYGAYSSVSLSRYPGTFNANAEVRTEVTAGAMKEFMYELKRISAEPVGAVELANAKRALVGRFALALEEPRSFIAYVLEQKLYNFPADYWDKFAQRVDAVTAADVQRVAKKYLDPKRFQFVAVGDAAKISNIMKQYEAP